MRLISSAIANNDVKQIRSNSNLYHEFSCAWGSYYQQLRTTTWNKFDRIAIRIMSSIEHRAIWGLISSAIANDDVKQTRWISNSYHEFCIRQIVGCGGRGESGNKVDNEKWHYKPSKVHDAWNEWIQIRFLRDGRTNGSRRGPMNIRFEVYKQTTVVKPTSLVGMTVTL